MSNGVADAMTRSSRLPRQDQFAFLPAPDLPAGAAQEGRERWCRSTCLSPRRSAAKTDGEQKRPVIYQILDNFVAGVGRAGFRSSLRARFLSPPARPLVPMCTLVAHGRLHSPIPHQLSDAFDRGAVPLGAPARVETGA